MYGNRITYVLHGALWIFHGEHVTVQARETSEVIALVGEINKRVKNRASRQRAVFEKINVLHNPASALIYSA